MKPLKVKEQQNQLRGDADQGGGAFDVGIVFVLDTTQSMETYIARTQKVLQNTVQKIAGTEIGIPVSHNAKAPPVRASGMLSKIKIADFNRPKLSIKISKTMPKVIGITTLNRALACCCSSN